MQSPILIHTALHPEALPLIEELRARKQIISGSFELYSSDSVHIVVSGVGKIRTTAAIAAVSTRLFPETRGFHLLNIGIAGSSNLKVGSLCHILKCIDRTTKHEYYPDLIVKLPGVGSVLETHESAVKDSECLTDKRHIVDMEGSAFFESGRMFTSCSRLHSLKVVSDNLSCSIPSKQFISDLISSHSIKIVDVVNELTKNSAFLTNILNHNENSLVQRISDSLDLTFSQKVILEDQIHFYKTSKGSLPETLSQFIKMQPDNKRERNEILKSIRSELEV